MNDGGLIPPPQRHSGRYSERPDAQRPWGVTEDLVLWPVLAACGSEYTYRCACLFLCETLGREPVYPASASPDTKTVQDDAVALIERRTVTAVLAGDRPAVTRLAAKLPYARSGQPLTWAESERLIPAYVRKLVEKKSVVSELDLFALLARSPGTDGALVRDRIAAVRGGKRDAARPSRRTPPLGNVLAWVVRDFARTPPESLDDLAAYWTGLVAPETHE